MLLSIFAPTIIAAENADVGVQLGASENEETGKKQLVYVSLGDSMTNYINVI